MKQSSLIERYIVRLLTLANERTATVKVILSRPGVLEDELNILERKVGRLDPEHRRLLLLSDGGKPTPPVFGESVVEFFYSVTHESRLRTIMGGVTSFGGIFMMDLTGTLIPLAEASAGDCFFVDMRTGSVLLWIHDEDGDRLPTNVVADSVEAFISGFSETL